MLSAKETIRRLFSEGGTDRITVRDTPWKDTIRKWKEQGYPVDDAGKPLDPVDAFDYDMAGCGAKFEWKAKIVEEVLIEETEEWKTVRDGNGAVLKWWKNKSGTPEHMAFDMTSRNRWETEYKPHVVGSAGKRVTPKVVDEVSKNLKLRKEQGLWTHLGQRFVWEIMRGSFGDICLYESLLTDPEWIHDFNRAYTDLNKECYSLIFENAGLPDGIWMYEDLGYKDRLFCSPQLFQDLIFPHL